jgi:hypothetical protein
MAVLPVHNSVGIRINGMMTLASDSIMRAV